MYWSYAACASEFNSISDEIIKTSINNLELGLNRLTKLRPVTYSYKNKHWMGIILRIGSIAQELKEILPEILKINHMVKLII